MADVGEASVESDKTGGDFKFLEALVVNNPELERLEALLGQFNIFEAIGAIRQELRHSDFLAFLLNPQQNHGLGDAFAKRLLQRALASEAAQSIPITPIDLDLWSLDGMYALREWQNIDILLLDESHRMAVVIENKIGTGEHSGQLARYYNTVVQHYPGWRVIALYLTPEGLEPSDQKYIPIDYGAVCSEIEGLLEKRASTLGEDVRTLMAHYNQMLRRHIVSDSEIADLCRRIYRKHQRALDLILEHRPDLQAELREFIELLIRATPGMAPDFSAKWNIRFVLEEWDVPTLLSGNGWTASGRILLFEFVNTSDRLYLKLVIGPGPDETRRGLFEMARRKQPPFKPSMKNLYAKWNTIMSRPFLKAKSYQEADVEELTAEIRKEWEKFLRNELPLIVSSLREEEWVWR